MKENKIKILISAILTLAYVIGVLVYSYFKDGIFSKEKTENIIMIIEYSIYFISIIYGFVISLNKKIDLNKCKTGILIISILYFLSNIISGILCFTVYGSLDKIKKRELPVLEDIKEHSRLFYFIIFVICMILLMIVPNYIPKKFSFIVYIIIFLTSILSFKKRLKRDFSVFKEYFKEYFVLVLKTWGKALILMAIISLLIRSFTGITTSTNQELINQMFKKIPLFTILLTVIYAPISEELLFRGCFKEVFKNKILFILLSGFVFGLMHVIDDYSSVKELLYILVYGSLGSFLAAIYYKTNNIFANITFHFMQNTLSMLLLLLMSLT